MFSQKLLFPFAFFSCVYCRKNATIKNDFWFIRCIVNGALVEGKREDQVGKEKSNYVLWLDIKLIWFFWRVFECRWRFFICETPCSLVISFCVSRNLQYAEIWVHFSTAQISSWIGSVWAQSVNLDTHNNLLIMRKGRFCCFTCQLLN